jgi:hypothetical protein
MFKKLLLIFVIVSILPFTVSAQSTGKIVGQIMDTATGEPLPGVNITIDNTLLGANSDFDGYYVILNVPVGIYTVRASFIGFQEVAMEGVRVSSNITTDANFDLKETPLELDEVIVITGQRPLVEKNITQSYSLVTAKEIESIPVRGVNSILALQASVVVQDGNIHIRGGRANETGYFLDGVNVTNPINNTRAVHIIQEAVEEMQVLAGGYTAEYGGANAGIVKTDLKTGSSDWHFSLDAQTDGFQGQGEKFLDTYSYGQSVIVGTVSGPLLTKNIRLFAGVENYYSGDASQRFSEGFEFNDLPNTNPQDLNVALGDPEIVDITYPDGITPKNAFNRWALNGTLLFDYKPVQFRVSGLYTYQKQTATNQPMLNTLNSRQSFTNFNTALISGKLTWIVNQTSFLDAKVSYFNRNTETEDPWFGTDWKLWSDSAAVSDYTGGAVTYRSAYRSPYPYRLLGMNFNQYGTSPVWYTTTNQSYIGGNLDFVTQFNKYNELKVGAEMRQFTMKRYAIQPTAVELLTSDAGPVAEEDVPVTAFGTYAGAIYGYDYWGNEVSSGFLAPREPLFLSAYAQDKIEFKDLIINLGLRYDYFDADDRELKDPSNPDVDANTSQLEESAWKDKDPFAQLSPRLGISFPVSDRSVFYAQYGIFVQMPELNNVYYDNVRFSRQIVTGSNYYINPIGYAMDPMRTTQYEIGFRQQLGEFAAIDITGFYKNVKGLPQTIRVAPTAGADIPTYYKIGNGDFATTKGLEFKFTLRRVERWQVSMNYTLTSAEGTGSDEKAYYSAVYRGSQIPTTTSPLNFENAHRGSVLLDYRFGVGDGGPILQRSGINFIFNFNSGHPYTFSYAAVGGQSDAYSAGTDYLFDTRSRTALESQGSSTTPWNFYLDMRLDKSFTIYEQLLGTVYVRVTNLLNTKNVVNVYPTTGSAVDDGYISDPNRYSSNVEAYGPQYLDLYRAINSTNASSYLNDTGNEIYGVPRVIWLGLKLTY